MARWLTGDYKGRAALAKRHWLRRLPHHIACRACRYEWLYRLRHRYPPYIGPWFIGAVDGYRRGCDPVVVLDA